MIDIHCHLLPGLDDGPETEAESIKMMEIAVQDGIEAIVATPHVFSFINKDITPEMAENRFNAFKQKTLPQASPLKIYPGAEVYFVSDLLDQLKLHRPWLTLNNSDYFLLEMPTDFISETVNQTFFNILSSGFIPILCHVERHQIYQQHPEQLFQLLQSGALAHITATSLQGTFGPDARAAALKFLRLNMIHVIATDAHDGYDRKPQLSFLYHILKEFSPEQIDLWIKRVPLAIINNRAIPDIGPMSNPTQKSFFNKFWRR